jgi:hypothetical protein
LYIDERGVFYILCPVKYSSVADEALVRYKGSNYRVFLSLHTPKPSEHRRQLDKILRSITPYQIERVAVAKFDKNGHLRHEPLRAEDETKQNSDIFAEEEIGNESIFESESTPRTLVFYNGREMGEDVPLARVSVVEKDEWPAVKKYKMGWIVADRVEYL